MTERTRFSEKNRSALFFAAVAAADESHTAKVAPMTPIKNYLIIKAQEFFFWKKRENIPTLARAPGPYGIQDEKPEIFYWLIFFLCGDEGKQNETHKMGINVPVGLFYPF